MRRGEQVFVFVVEEATGQGHRAKVWLDTPLHEKYVELCIAQCKYCEVNR